MDRVTRALELGDRLMAGEPLAPTSPAPARRAVALGDPQAATAHLLALLEHHRLLGEDGWLREDVQLVSIGDHFDFGGHAEVAKARVDGPRFLRWLAAHPRSQVTILFGNHDAARVMELAFADDERFAAATPLASELAPLQKPEPARFEARVAAEYAPRFPELPGPGLVDRDFSAFTTAQRALVRELLLAGRFRLAATATRAGVPVLCTHAGVTSRELRLLGAEDERDVSTLAAALDELLRAAVAAVEPAWRAGQAAALSLAPLQIPGDTAARGDARLPEGGGLLYHRPAETPETKPERPRRYHPHTLPRGLVQACGHTGHGKCVEELRRWRDPHMVDEPAGLRTLRVRADDVHYQLGADDARADDAVLYMIDPTLSKVHDVTRVELLELDPGSIG